MSNEKQYCPVCGTEVKVISGDEGTCYYEPIQKIEALKEKLNALETFATASNEMFEDKNRQIETLSKELNRIKEGIRGLEVLSESKVKMAIRLKRGFIPSPIYFYYAKEVNNLLTGEK